jgi:hypothetical protein
MVIQRPKSPAKNRRSGDRMGDNLVTGGPEARWHSSIVGDGRVARVAIPPIPMRQAPRTPMPFGLSTRNPWAMTMRLIGSGNAISLRHGAWYFHPDGYTIPIVRLRKLHLRLLALVVALVQLTGPAAAALADAQLEAAGNQPNAASHIEAHGRPECARVHTDDCAICQYLATAFDKPAVPRAAPLPSATVRPQVAALLGHAPAALGALPRSRGPPVLV